MNPIKKWLRKREIKKIIRGSLIEFNEASKYLYTNSKADCEYYTKIEQVLKNKILLLVQELYERPTREGKAQ